MYINFYFKDLEYTDKYYKGYFSCTDLDIFCDFIYNRETGETEIYNNSQPKEKILPLPIYWLDKQLEEKGK